MLYLRMEKQHAPVYSNASSLGHKSNRFSSSNKKGTVRVSHHSRRHVPEVQPGNRIQPSCPQRRDWQARRCPEHRRRFLSPDSACRLDM